jgi:hypothetical protein
MNVDTKIAEAEFFFKKVNSTAPKFNDFGDDENESKEKPEALECYINAFLGAARSITDYLLYDYALHFGLVKNPEDPEEQMNLRLFEEQAKNLGKLDAQNFIIDFKKELDLLTKDSNYSFLKDLRDTSVHRTPIDYTVASEAKNFRKIDDYYYKLIFLDDPLLEEKIQHLPTAVQRCRRFIRSIKGFVKTIGSKYPM